MTQGMTLQGGAATTSFGPFLGQLAMKALDKAVDVGAQIGVAAYNNHNAKRAAQRQYENTMNLMNMQYDLNRRAYDYQMTQGPTLYRKGLSDAGYNPILPFVGGSGLTNASFGSSGLGSAALENPAFIDGNAINQARLLHENVQNIKSQTELNNANTNLTNEKVITETYEQDLRLLDKSRKEIENKWLPSQIKADIKQKLSNAYAAVSDAITNRINAHTGIVNARVGERNATTNEVNSRINSIDVMNRFTLGQDQLELEWNKLIREQQYDAIKSLVKDLITVYGIGRCAPMLKPLLSKSPQAVHQAIKTMGDPVYQSIMNSKL